MNLDKIRENIDIIDAQIVQLLNKRFKEVIKVGEWKKNKNQAIYVPEREKSLLEKLKKLNNGPINNKTLFAIYREVMSGAIALEHPISISFLGPDASFCQLAALKKFGRSVKYLSKNSIKDIFNEIENERSDYGCVPIENSTEGVINHTLDMFINSNVKICSEINMKIHNNLLSNCNFSDIKTIYSHHQIFSQCKNWILEYLPNAEIIEVASSTKAAQYAINNEFSAAIASSLSAEIYDLNILRKNIEDNPNNITRFLIISKQEPYFTNDDKTSLCFKVNDEVGALYEALFPFKENNITLSMIESRCSKINDKGSCFFIDIKGHISEKKIILAIDKLKKMCKFVKILGSYPISNELF